MNHHHAHEGVVHALTGSWVLVSATGRDTAKLHMALEPDLLLQAITISDPRFHWAPRLLCGTTSTAGWESTTWNDGREMCAHCRRLWESLADLYRYYANPRPQPRRDTKVWKQAHGELEMPE